MNAVVTSECIAQASGVTKRRIQARAAKENWQYSEEHLRGGRRRLYAIDQLPLEIALRVRAELARRAAISAGLTEAHGRGKEATPTPALPKDRPAERWQPVAEAREDVVQAFLRYQRASGQSQRQALDDFPSRYAAREAGISPQTHSLIPTVSGPTVKRWLRDYRARGLAGLAPRYGNRAGDGKIDRDEALKTFVVGMLVQFPHASAAQIHDGLQTRFKDAEGGADRDLPTLRNLQRWIERWKADNAVALAAVTNPDGFKGKYQAAFGSYSEGLGLNDLWELDSTIGDVELDLGDGKRHALVACIDVHSRRAKVLVAPTSRAKAIMDLTGRCILAWGVPHTVKTDNGKDYVSNHAVRVLTHLEIEHKTCRRFSPEEKPHVERFIKTLQHWLFELLPGYTGHNVAERKIIEARKSFAARRCAAHRGGDTVIKAELTPADLQSLIDEWLAAKYEHDAHEGLGGKTPFETAAAWDKPVRRIEDAEALAVLLAEAPADGGKRRITKRGLRLNNTVYMAPALGPLVGREVRVLLNDADAGAVYVFATDGRFHCEAVAPELRGISRHEIAKKAKQMQRERLKEDKALLRRARGKAGTKDIAREVLKDRAKTAGKLVRLPHTAEPHNTAALGEARQAARARDFDLPQETPEMAAAKARTATRLRTADVVPIPQTADDRFARALRIEAALDAGEAVAAEDADWFAGYRQTAEFKAKRRTAEAFGRLPAKQEVRK